jgi:phage terminase Nu1 subunit (DNA packaging protein)
VTKTLSAAEAAVRHASARHRVANANGDVIEAARARVRLTAAQLALAELTQDSEGMKAARSEHHRARYELKEIANAFRSR